MSFSSTRFGMLSMTLAAIGAMPVVAHAAPINAQTTDAVTQTNVQVLSTAPSMAMGSLYQTVVQTLPVPIAPACGALAADCAGPASDFAVTPVLFVPALESLPRTLDH